MDRVSILTNVSYFEYFEAWVLIPVVLCFNRFILPKLEPTLKTTLWAVSRVFKTGSPPHSAHCNGKGTTQRGESRAQACCPRVCWMPTPLCAERPDPALGEWSKFRAHSGGQVVSRSRMKMAGCRCLLYSDVRWRNSVAYRGLYQPCTPRWQCIS